MRIVFMGTPDFAVATLKQIVSHSTYEVVAVVTAPDKPAGRGQKLQASPVKLFALKCQIPVLQPVKLRASTFLQELKSYNADLQVVVAFRMLPEAVWAMPRFGTVNLHGSLLPQYRGAAPINWVIINGESKTGVTTFFIQKEIDTGDILLSHEMEIFPLDDAGTLHDRMMAVGAELVIGTLEKLEADQLKGYPQPIVESLKLAPKIFKEDTQINWKNPAFLLHNFIRGLSPFPGAFTSFKGKTLKIFKTQVLGQLPERVQAFQSEGFEYYSDFKTCLIVQTSEGFLSISDLKLEGKRRMTVEEFLRGFRLDT